MGFSAVKPFSYFRLIGALLGGAYAGWFMANQVADSALLGAGTGAAAWLMLALGPILGCFSVLAPPEEGTRRPGRRAGWFVLGCILLGLHVRTSLVERVAVVGSSMAPAYRPGDVLWVEKISTGLRPPALEFPFGSPFRSGLVPTLGWAAPERGAVVVVQLPGADRKLVKRVVAIAGDAYEIEPSELGPVQQLAVDVPASHFALLGPDARRSLIEGCPDRGVVPAHTVLVLGDNRRNSRDSRSFGFVPIFYIEGVAINGRPRGTQE